MGTTADKIWRRQLEIRSPAGTRPTRPAVLTDVDGDGSISGDRRRTARVGKSGEKLERWRLELWRRGRVAVGTLTLAGGGPDVAGNRNRTEEIVWLMTFDARGNCLANIPKYGG
jgi:hypothetical protein